MARDYVGHKLVLMWKPGPSDSLLTSTALPISTLRLEPNPSLGHHVHTASMARFWLNVQISRVQTSQDDVSSLYSGVASVERVQLSFAGLVRAAAKRQLGEPVTAVSGRKGTILAPCPVLEHELKHQQFLQEAAQL